MTIIINKSTSANCKEMSPCAVWSISVWNIEVVVPHNDSISKVCESSVSLHTSFICPHWTKSKTFESSKDFMWPWKESLAQAASRPMLLFFFFNLTFTLSEVFQRHFPLLNVGLGPPWGIRGSLFIMSPRNPMVAVSGLLAPWVHSTTCAEGDA